MGIVSLDSTPFASDFPESNTAYHYTGDNELYSYGEENTTEMLHDGVGFNSGDFIHYTDAVKNMEYPFSYTERAYGVQAVERQPQHQTAHPITKSDLNNFLS